MIKNGYRLSAAAEAAELRSMMASGIGHNGPPQAYAVVDLQGETLPEFMMGGYAATTGRTVSEKQALKNATFFRAMNLTASSIGMLPLQLFVRKDDGDRDKVRDHPVAKLLRRPNDYQTPFEFKTYMQGRALLRGNGYAYKIPGMVGGKRATIGLAPLDPQRVTPVLTDEFTLGYDYQPKSGAKRRFAKSEIFHLRAPWSSDGICGDGLLKVAVEALGLAGALDEATGRLMLHGSYIGGILKHPKSLSDEAAKRLRADFATRFTGAENAGRWIVAEEGMEAQVFGASGRDAQGAEQRKLQAEEIARFTGVPRPLLMFDETSWGSGIEALGLFFVTYCLLPWFVAWEETLARDLLSDAEQDRYFAKFNEAALLRGSMKDQAEFFAKALGGPGATGFMIPNEAREKMDLNRRPDCEEPGWGQQSAAQPGGADGA